MDIEASGFGRHSYPIEIGYVLPDGGGYCTLVRPEAAWTHWDAEAQRLHGISRDAVLLHGRPALEIARHLNQVLRGQTVYTDGWANDYSWIGTLFSSTIGFWLGRAFGGRLIRDVASEGVARFMKLIGRNGFMASLIVRLVPAAPFIVVNMAAGVAPMRFRDFVGGNARRPVTTGNVTLSWFPLERLTFTDLDAVAVARG